MYSSQYIVYKTDEVRIPYHVQYVGASCMCSAGTWVCTYLDEFFVVFPSLLVKVHVGILPSSFRAKLHY